MTKEELKIFYKATALNKIRDLYNPHNYENGVGLSNHSWSESWAEQRNDIVKNIIDILEKQLSELK